MSIDPATPSTSPTVRMRDRGQHWLAEEKFCNTPEPFRSKEPGGAGLTPAATPTPTPTPTPASQQSQDQEQPFPQPPPTIRCRGSMTFEQAKTFGHHGGNFIFHWQQQSPPHATLPGKATISSSLRPQPPPPSPPASEIASATTVGGGGDGGEEGWFFLLCDDRLCREKTRYFWRHPFISSSPSMDPPALSHFNHFSCEQIIEKFAWKGKCCLGDLTSLFLHLLLLTFFALCMYSSRSMSALISLHVLASTVLG